MFNGIAVSTGVAIGKAYLLDRSKVCVVKRAISPDQTEEEIQRLRDAIQLSKDQLQDIKTRASSIADKYAIILDTYTLLLEDEILVTETIENIRKNHVNAEWALTKTLEKFTHLFDNINDDYLKGKQDDLDLVVHGVIKNLIGHHQESLADIDEPVVIITHALSPSDTLMMSKSYILGMATEVGGKTSHVGIFASALGIPAVVGINGLTQHIDSGDTVIIDGLKGEVIVNPDDQQIDFYTKKKQNFARYEKTLLEDIDLTAETLDGHKIQLMANIESSHEAKSIRKYGGEGIGLYRTEFLYLGPQALPTEHELYANFKKVVEGMNPSPVVIRTLDIGSDKQVMNVTKTVEANPALGLRGIRLSLSQPDLLIAQMRGILRASLYGKAKILYPMVSSVEEVIAANELLAQVKADLKKAQIPFNKNIEVGAMIETPAAALVLEHILEHVDFVSIGTNDLIQYLLAVDRVNENVAHLYQPFHLSVLRVLKNIFTVAESMNKPVSICGELGGDPMATLLLLGLGKTNQLSMELHSIPKVKKILRKVSIKEAREFADHVLTLSAVEDINRFITTEMRRKFPEDFDQDMTAVEK